MCTGSVQTLSSTLYGQRTRIPHCTYYTLGTPWERIPFVLMSATAVLQRIRDNCLADCRDQFAPPYLDDVLVYSESFEDYVNHLQQILPRFRERGIKLKPSKCKFFKKKIKKIKFLSHIVTAESYKVDPSLTKPINKFLGDPPSDIESVCKHVVLLGYFRRHIQSFSLVALQTAEKRNQQFQIGAPKTEMGFL